MKRRREEEEEEKKYNIIEWLDLNNIYNDIWILHILKYWLSPIELIKLSIVCKRFLKDLKMGELIIAVTRKCYECGNCIYNIHGHNHNLQFDKKFKEFVFEYSENNYFSIYKYNIKVLQFLDPYNGLNLQIIIDTPIQDIWGGDPNSKVFKNYILIEDNQLKKEFNNRSIIYYEIYWKKDCPSDKDLLENSIKCFYDNKIFV